MSRGPGRIERAVRQLFDANPDLAFTTDELAEHCYPGVNAIERKHQVAVLRAAWKVLEDDPNWHAWRIQGMGRGYVFVNHASVPSYTLGHMIAGPLPDIIYRSEKRAQRRPYDWVSVPGGFRKKMPTRCERQYIPDRTALLNLHAEYVAGGGRDWLTRKHIVEAGHAATVADHIAYRDGNWADRAALEAKWEARNQEMIALGRSGLAGPVSVTQPPSPDGNETLTNLAAKARALVSTNDPDAVRAGLAEIAEALDRLGGTIAGAR
jgi:hypothetical protein